MSPQRKQRGMMLGHISTEIYLRSREGRYPRPSLPPGSSAMMDCIACDLSFEDERALEKHWDHCHPSLASINRSVKDVQVTPPAPIFYCDECYKSFPTIAACTKHVKRDVCRGPRPRYGIANDGHHESCPLLATCSTASSNLITFFDQFKPKRVMAKMRRRSRWNCNRYSVI
ncbi:hypothetical protein IW261DRAFT_84348 [Armillaria novae-zelandiae]|uniref:C2H2-type domain-containing protein n=1 Tax=Armillaria novae-zelandiae TaxID=153914 RepID=A0AA39UKA4_9AGAR|nr:hypothetical protein IW261DRAFT_84348 [Armillaria novae-zelandiae]